jgi:hypothetical protein
MKRVVYIVYVSLGAPSGDAEIGMEGACTTLLECSYEERRRLSKNEECEYGSPFVKCLQRDPHIRYNRVSTR